VEHAGFGIPAYAGTGWGTGAGMTETPRQATSVGQTGGLPGANADPRASTMSAEELADTVAMADVSDDDRSDATDDGTDPTGGTPSSTG